MTTPLLILSPNEMRNRDGLVSPVIHEDVTVVAGDRGDAWRFPTGMSTLNPGLRMPLSQVSGLNSERGSIVVRYKVDNPALEFLVSVGSTAAGYSIHQVYMSASAIGVDYRNDANAIANIVISGATAESSYFAETWSGADIHIRTEIGSDSRANRGEYPYQEDANLDIASYTTNGVDIEGVLLFDRALSDAQLDTVIGMGKWTWQGVIDALYVPPVLPRRQGSRVSHVETVVYETDRNNEARKPLSGVTSVQTDWDIDRSGSKARVDIATHKRSLRDGMWIAPHMVITPEVGDIVEQQIGHFRLGIPTSVIDGSVDTWGDDKIEQSATGGDIVDLLAQAGLPYTFYTPVGGNVMTDIHTLIKMATCGAMGPNLISNHSFESEGADWVGPAWTSGGQGQFGWDSFWEYPDGVKVFRTTFSESNPAGGGGYIRTQDIPIPAGAEYLYMSGVGYGPSNMRMYISMRFHDGDGAPIPGANVDSLPPGAVSRSGQWARQFKVVPVHDGAAYVRLWLFSVDLSGGRATSTIWDDIRLGVCTQMPLPDHRINLPPSNAVASTRIQTTAGSSIGYDAINADRLSAIGHHAIYTDLTGRLTSSPSRDLGSATVSRTYREGDYRFVGAFEVQRSANNRYNTVTAVKESFEEGVPPLFVTVWNDDVNDPWSVHHLGNVRYPNGPLMVQDAVDTDALESAAMAALARATEQHVLRITVLPDPTLTVHDVIEIVGGPEEAQGRWLVEYMRPGTEAGDPVVEIGARRTLTSAGVSGVDMGGMQ